jgi:hypothetical protein
VPRKNNRRSAEGELDPERALRGAQSEVSSADGAWLVRHITAAGALKVYRCPGCDHEIASGVPHVVAWPADDRGDLGDRRHWHTGCWHARGRRAPVIQRSRRAPRAG